MIVPLYQDVIVVPGETEKYANAQLEQHSGRCLFYVRNRIIVVELNVNSVARQRRKSDQDVSAECAVPSTRGLHVVEVLSMSVERVTRPRHCHRTQQTHQEVGVYGAWRPRVIALRHASPHPSDGRRRRKSIVT